MMPNDSALPRDSKLDQLGFIAELQKQYGDALKTTIKASMLSRSIDRATGDFFSGLLVSSTPTTVDPDKLLRMLERKTISRKEFLSAVSVKTDKCRDFLSRDKVDSIATTGTETLSLRVTRLNGVEILLVDAIKGLASELAKDQAA